MGQVMFVADGIPCPTQSSLGMQRMLGKKEK